VAAPAVAAAARAGLAVVSNRGLLARAALWALLALLGVLALALSLLGIVAGVGGPISPAALPAGARPFLRIYEDAARVYQVSPFLLMAVHEDESSFSSSTLPGVGSGLNFAGCCAGPMQFYIAGGASPAVGGSGATWAGYRHAYRRAQLPRPGSYPLRVERPHPNVYDSYDSIYAAASYFRALGAGARLDSRSFQALVSYKGSPPASIPYARADYERARELQSLARNASETPSPPTAGGGRLAWPVVGPVVSPYGMRWGRLHAGIDIAVPAGTPIYAAATGRVTTKGWVGGYGNYTCLDHGRQISTCYAHQSRFGPTPSGGVLGRGQLVGWVGCTGHCFGPHLHFELRIAGRPTDPLPYLRGR
jgi:murein DD-endopeptidase MepM/ murein hydrolase activator NlpD